jgi:Plasmid pRiA4b ORF-3-like protein
LAGTVSHLSAVPSDPDALRAWLLRQGYADALRLGLGNREVELPDAPKKPRALTIDVDLRRAKGPEPRRLVVPGDTALDRAHDILQAAMGWSGGHQHRFYAGPSQTDPHFVTEAGGDEGDGGTPEGEVRLDQLLVAPGDAIRYEYDADDGTALELRLVTVSRPKADPRPRCIGGPGAEEADERLRAMEANEQLLDRLRPGAVEAISRLSPGAAATVSGWVTAAAEAVLSASDIAALASPYRILLDAIGDGATLTPSGYLPSRLVEELWPALEIDPILAGKANREHNIRPLVMFREAAEQTGLLSASPRKVAPTEVGTRVARDPDALWAHVSARLPLGEAELELEVGWFTLLAVAGGLGRTQLFTTVHELCVDAGWNDEDGEPIPRDVTNALMWPTLAALVGARWNSRERWPAWVPAAAAEVVFSLED